MLSSASRDQSLTSLLMDVQTELSTNPIVDPIVDLYLFCRQLSKEAMAAWSDNMDPDGVPNSVRAMLSSFRNVLGMDTFGLVEETIPRSSFQRNYSLVHSGGSAHTSMSVREG